MSGPEQERPIARPVASSPESSSPQGIAASGAHSAPDINDDRVSSLPKVQRRTAEAIRAAEAAMSKQDWQLLRIVHRFRLLSGQQLQALFHGSDSAGGRAARRRLLRLHKLDVLCRLDRRVGGVRGGSAGYIYATGLVGQRLLNQGRRARRHKEPGWPFLRHTLAISELYVQIETATRGSEAELVSFDPEPHSWRSQSWLNQEMHLRPDAFVTLDVADTRQLWFIEVDLGTESRPTIRKKMAQYQAWLETGYEQEGLGAFPRVLWHTPDQRRREQLQELAEQAPGPSGLHSTTGLLDGLLEIREPP